MDSKSESSRIVIGHLLTSIWVGGLERFVLGLVDTLPRDRFEFVVYSWMGDDPWKSEFDSRGIPVRALWGSNRLSSVLAPVKIAVAWSRLAYQLRRDRIQILHTHDFFPSFVGRTASILAGVPHRVTTLHNLYDWWPGWTHSANRILARRTDALTCVSNSVRDYFIAHEGLPPYRYRTILNGVDEVKFAPDSRARSEIRQELGIGEREILIGSVGSITSRKAQHILVQAVKPLVAQGMPLQVRIWGANQTNPQHAERDVREMIEALELGDRVKILPPRSDIHRVYSAMDIHCMTSIAEGLSLASVEGLLSGPVCVYSDIGPFREVVDDDRTGFLFRSGDPAHLASVLSRVIPSLDAMEGLREAARRVGVERFGLARMGKDYASLYLELLKE